MIRRLLALLTLAFLIFVLNQPNLLAQVSPVCDSGGVCGTDPNPKTDPSYAGLLTARPQVQNARGTRNPTVAVSGSPGAVPIVIGSQSYNKSFSIVSLRGRGLDLNLTLYYNSRVWDVDTANAAISLNTDRDSPSYGFRLDFGFMEYDANSGLFVLTESDGTKHAMPLTANTNNGAIFDSNDGTSIEFNNQNLVLVYRDGTTMKYQAFPSQATLFRPIQVKDRNGNFITINYVAGTGNDQHIDTVVDTLGRVIKFVYDGANHLSKITQAVSSTTDPTGTHVWASFSWAQIPLTYNFSGLSVLSSPASGNSIWALTGCSFANLTGYKFSYGAWGIINRIDQLSSTGKIRSYETYNYPDASQPLSDAPRYTSMTMSPDGTATSQWNYAETQSARGQVTSESVTDPLGTTTISTLNTNGTLKSVQITDNTGKIFRTLSYQWSTSGPLLVSSVTTTDDAGNQSSVLYGYDAYNNVIDFGENDFGGQNIRHTITTYMPAPYTTNHILNLQKSVQIKDASGTVRQRTDFNYDETAPTSLGAVTQNDGSITTPRGNMTSMTRYSDAATPAGAIIRNFTYDSTGNMTIAQLDCCNQKKFNFDPNSKYAYLTSVVRGPDGGQQFTQGFNFNPDNGLLLSGTDENNQPTSYGYDSMYRVKNVTPPRSNGTSISESISYADDLLAPTVTTSSTANSAVLIQTFDGLGHLTRQDTQDSTTGSFVSTTQFQYDPIWRRQKTSNPYAPSEAVLWNGTGYDALNRVTSITPPSGGNSQFNFVGNTVLITDPAGKQRKDFLDASGRVVRVDEPGWGDALTAIDSIAISGGERSKTYVPPPQKCPRPPLPCDPQPSDPVTVYDTGMVTATISGVMYSQNYGQNDTTTSVAGNLANKINSDPGRSVNASPSGSTIKLYAVNPGVGGNAISVSTSSVTSDSTDFGSNTTSFPASAVTPGLTGGENAVAQANAVISATRHLTTTYTYDVLDQLRAVSQGAIGPINGQTFAGQARSYSYDDLGRSTSSTTPESGTITNYYTKADGTSCSGDSFAICRTVDARNIIKTFAYNDPINRPTGVTYSDSTPSATYAYDMGGQAAFALGRITQISENGNSQAFTYDNVGRITSVMNVIGGVNYQVQYGYNPDNRLNSITYPSGRIIKPDYYSVGFLKQIAAANAPSSPYLQINNTDYNGAGQVKNLAYGNGVKGAATYNDHMQIASLRYFNPAVPAGTPDVLNLSYDYGAANNGQIQVMHFYTTPGVEDKTKSEMFSYDPWSRLSAAQTVQVDSTPGTWNVQWNYDRLGNRLQQTLVGGNVSIVQPNFIVDAGTNHITNSGFTYDNSGNLTHDATATYTYDGANRLTSVNNGSAVATYTYVGPLRIKKVNGGTATVYVYSGSRPIAEYVNGSVSKEYIYAGSTLVATLAGTSVTYHHPDQLSNRAETDASGNIVRSFGHFPYGETWYETGTADKLKYTTYERDSAAGETGLDYAMFRNYNSGEGRFMNADLLGGDVFAPQSLNRYSYVTGDPVNLLDPLGLCGIVTATETSTSPNGTKTTTKTVKDEGPCASGPGNSGGCGGPCGGGGDNGGHGGGGGNDSKDKKAADCRRLKDEAAVLDDIARNTAFPDTFITDFKWAEGGALVAGCLVGGFVTIEAGFFGGCAAGAGGAVTNPEVQGGITIGAFLHATYEGYQAARQAKAAKDLYNATCVSK